MATNVPFSDPQFLYESKDIAVAFGQKLLKTESLRNNEALQEIREGKVSTVFLRGVRGLPFYNAYTEPSSDSSAIAFERHFNPMMKQDSAYFNSVDKLIGCVEKNADKGLSEDEQNKVCSQEMNGLRLKAFRHELLYHNMNKRFYMDLIQMKRGEAPY